MKSRLLALAALTLAMACEGTRQPTGVTAPTDPSKIISDGAHCGTPGIVCNPDFFFLPPMVPLPLNNPNFELGKFNNTLQRSLTITICELQSTPVNSQGLPTSDTQCKTGPALKTFAAGTVQLVNLPLRQTGWWTLGMSFTPDGMTHFYASPGVDPLTERDHITTTKPYGHTAEMLNTFFFNIVSPDDGRSWSTEWIVDDPTLYYYTR